MTTKGHPDGEGGGSDECGGCADSCRGTGTETPSLEVGIGMILSVTKPSNLVQAMVGLCPEAETDDDEGGDSVLVMQ